MTIDKRSHILFINLLSIININRLIDIDRYGLPSIIIDWIPRVLDRAYN